MRSREYQVVCACVVACTVRAVALGAPEALEAARAAAREQSSRTLLYSGDAEFFGASGGFTALLTPDGRFRYEIRADIGLLEVFDGVTLWERDWHGAVREMSLGEREVARLQGALLSGQWAGENGLLEFADEAGPNGSLRFSVRGGLLEGVLMLDAATRLPARVETTTPGAEYLFELLEYAPTPVAHPTHFRVTNPQGNTVTHRITQVVVGRSTRAGDFAEPAPDGAGVAWDNAQNGAIETQATRTGHHLVRALVNGQDLGWFVFDTGAGGSVLTPRVVEALALPTIGSAMVGGVGGSVASDIVRAESLTLGPLTLGNSSFAVLDLSFLDGAFGVQVAGIVGYDVLARVAVTIDVHEPSITLHRPGGRLDGEMWVDVHTYLRHPCVPASVEGHAGVYRLDTGAAGTTVSFHAPAVRRLGLLEGRETQEAGSGGVGGHAPMRTGTVATFELAGQTWRDLPAAFATDNIGAYADPFTDGNIGGRVMDRFVLTFDYPNKRVGFALRQE